MRVGVLGGRGTAGREVVAALERRGHEVRVLARSTGVDVTTGAGVDANLVGLDALVDCLGVKKASERAARPVLVDGLRATLERAAHLDIGHVVSLSIINCDRIPMSYYRAKVAQEDIVRAAPLPGTVLRATQFHQLLDQVWRATSPAGVIPAPRGLLAPLDPRDVGEALADAVEAGPDGPPLRRLCGPEDLTVSAAARTWRTASGSRRPILLLPAVGGALRALAAGLFVDPSAPRGTRTFAAWLSERRA